VLDGSLLLALPVALFSEREITWDKDSVASTFDAVALRCVVEECDGDFDAVKVFWGRVDDSDSDKNATESLITLEFDQDEEDVIVAEFVRDTSFKVVVGNSDGVLLLEAALRVRSTENVAEEECVWDTVRWAPDDEKE
jgi:hypothetical protein